MHINKEVPAAFHNLKNVARDLEGIRSFHKCIYAYALFDIHYSCQSS